MATYTQWRRAVDKNETRRVTYVCGPQRVLVDDVADTTRALVGAGVLDTDSTTGTDRERWAKAFQHPMTPGGNRLLVVRDAEKITSWAPFSSWIAGLRTLPGVYLLFVSGEDDLPRTGSSKRAPVKEHIEAMRPPRGHVVRCTELSEDDAVAWVKARSPLDDSTARHLLTRVAGHLGDAAAVCAKLSVFGPVQVSPAIVDQLVEARPADDFADSLLAGDKAAALAHIPALSDTDLTKLVALLDQRLDLFTQLWEAQAQGRYGRAVTGVNPYLVRKYTPLVKHYQPHRRARCRQVLAVVDDAVRSGSRSGVWEVLVALW